MCNQGTRGMATTRHRSLLERGGRKAIVRDKDPAHTKKRGEKKCQKNPDIHDSNEQDSST